MGELPTFNYLNSLLRYEPNTGFLYWKIRGRGRRQGIPVGGINSYGYVQISIDYERFSGHRLAWLLSTGRWPFAEIDHINHNKKDNRLINLRESTRSENKRNVLLQANNTSGLQGVNFNKEKNKWQVRIKIMGVAKHLGWFNTLDEAKQHRLRAEKNYYGDFAPNRSY